MEDLKTLIIVSLSTLMAYLNPINGILIAVTIAFTLNFLVGYLTGIVVQDESFSLKKAFRCCMEACVFFVVVASAYSIGEHLDNPSEAILSISIVTYVLLYFYSVNVFRNLTRLFPDSTWIAFTYWLISFEGIKKVPFLAAFLKSRKEVEHGED